MNGIIKLSITLGMAVGLCHGSEFLDTISESPDERFQVAIVYPSEEAKGEDKKIAPWAANYGSRPVVLIDKTTHQRVTLSQDTLASDIRVQWIKGQPCIGYYERDEACWVHDLYRIETKPRLKLVRVVLPSVEVIVTKLGDLPYGYYAPYGYYDPEYEWLSQELVSYSKKGELVVSLFTRSQVGRASRTPSLRYDVVFKTEDYRVFKPVFVSRCRWEQGGDPIASVILLYQ